MFDVDNVLTGAQVDLIHSANSKELPVMLVIIPLSQSHNAISSANEPAVMDNPSHAQVRQRKMVARQRPFG